MPRRGCVGRVAGVPDGVVADGPRRFIPGSPLGGRVLVGGVKPGAEPLGPTGRPTPGPAPGALGVVRGVENPGAEGVLVEGCRGVNRGVEGALGEGCRGVLNLGAEGTPGEGCRGAENLGEEGEGCLGAEKPGDTPDLPPGLGARKPPPKLPVPGPLAPKLPPLGPLKPPKLLPPLGPLKPPKLPPELGPRKPPPPPNVPPPPRPKLPPPPGPRANAAAGAKASTTAREAIIIKLDQIDGRSEYPNITTPLMWRVQSCWFVR
ncbi:MAG: hypothetical protein ACOX3G_09770 [Armatimonadota bacterium]